MQIGFLLLADHSEAVNGKLYMVGGGWNVLRFPELPSEWGFSIALALDVSWEETDTRHNMLINIQDPDGVELGQSLEAEFGTSRPPGMPAGQSQRLVMSVGTKATFATPGPHAAVVQVNDEEVGRTRFYVATGPAPDAQDQGFPADA